MNESSIEDSIEIEVNNYGMSQQSITYYLYLPQNIDVLDFSSKKIETSLSTESHKISTLKSFTLKGQFIICFRIKFVKLSLKITDCIIINLIWDCKIQKLTNDL